MSYIKRQYFEAICESLHNNTFLEIFWHQTFKAYQQIRHRFIFSDQAGGLYLWTSRALPC